jgi:hypothetical protein
MSLSRMVQLGAFGHDAHRHGASGDLLDPLVGEQAAARRFAIDLGEQSSNPRCSLAFRRNLHDPVKSLFG